MLWQTQLERAASGPATTARPLEAPVRDRGRAACTALSQNIRLEAGEDGVPVFDAEHSSRIFDVTPTRMTCSTDADCSYAPARRCPRAAKRGAAPAHTRRQLKRPLCVGQNAAQELHDGVHLRARQQAFDGVQ